jgi:uncharacterized membrane protein YhaH (DUF805 family)
MNFADAVKTCFRKYAIFNGTASRPEYWWFVLFNVLGSTVFLIIGAVALRSLWSLAMLLPGLAVAVRRLHDTGRSAWWLLTAVIAPWLIVLLCLRGKTTGNLYATGAGTAGQIRVSEADLRSTSSYCHVCGKLRLPGQAYCTQCGAQFSSD